MPPKKRTNFQDPTYIKRKKDRERRANMTEVERNKVKEKAQIKNKIRYALMSPESRKRRLELAEKASRRRRLARQIQPLEMELKNIKWQIEFYRKQGLIGDDKKTQKSNKRAAEQKLLDFKEQKSDLESRIRQIKEAPVDESEGAKYRRQQRANMTEAERNKEREKARINKKINYAFMSPERRERVLEAQRKAVWLKRKAEKLIALEEELKIMKLKIESIETSGENADDQKLLDLKEQEAELELEIRTIQETPVRPKKRRKITNLVEHVDDAEMAVQKNSPKKSTMTKNESIEAEGLADLTFRLAESMADPERLSEDEADQKMWPDETIEEWVQRVGNSNTVKQPEQKGELDVPPRRGRLVALKARATLSNLRRSSKANATPKEKAELQLKIAHQQKLILQLMDKYPEEFNVRKYRTNSPKQKRTPAKVNGKIKGNVTDRSDGKRQFRFPISKRETEEQRVARITKMIEFQAKSKAADLADQTPEERADQIIREVEEFKNKVKTKGRALTLISKSGCGIKEYERELERNIIQKSLETPEQRAERNARIAAVARQRNHMEKEEFRIFQILIASDDPLKSLQDEESAPAVLLYYYHCVTSTTRERKVPDALKDYRKKTYLLLKESQTGPSDESGESKMSILATQNADFKQWLADAVNLEPLTKYLTDRRWKLTEYYRNRNKVEKLNASQEEKEAKRKATNEKYRRYYLNKKMKEGKTIVPKGERAQPNTKSNLAEPDIPKPRIARKQRGSTALGDRRRKSGKVLSTHTEGISSDIARPVTVKRATIPGMSPRASTSFRWPSLTVASEVNVAASESPLQDDDRDDDWMPVSPFFEHTFHSQPHHNQTGAFATQYAGVNQSNLSTAFGVSTVNDEFFHRLIHVPTQNNFNSLVPQNHTQLPTMYPGIGNSNFGHPTHFQPLQPLQTHPWSQNASQSIESPLNYSISYHPTNSQVTLISETSPNSSIQRSDNSQNIHSVGNTDRSQVMEVSSNVDVQTTNHFTTKIKRTRRPRGQNTIKTKNTIKRKRIKNRKGYKFYIPKEAVKVTPSEPQILKFTDVELESRKECPHCPLTFLTQGKCDEHVKRRHEATDLIRCPLCSLACDKRSNLVGHLWQYHRRSLIRQCPICSTKYLSKPRFLRHLKAHPNDKNSYFFQSNKQTGRHDATSKYDRFWCDLCPSVFDSSFKLINHRQAHSYLCKECGILLKDADHLVYHTLRCHPNVTWTNTNTEEDYAKSVLVNKTVEVFTCKTCSSTFSTKEFLVAHEALGHPTLKKRGQSTCQGCDKILQQYTVHHCSMLLYKCYWCIQEFRKWDLFLQHLVSNHSEEKSVPKKIHYGPNNFKLFKCEFCRRSFSSLLPLRTHIERTHFPNPSKTNVTISNLETKKVVEEAIETPDVVPVVTSEVNDQTSNSNPATKLIMMDSTHKKSEVAQSQISEVLVVHPCHVCSSIYKTKEFLDKHISADHPDSSKHFKIICDICNKRIAVTSSLLRHKKAFHNSEDKNKYQCPQCPMKLTRPEHLRLHIKKIHENPTPMTTAKNLQRLLKITAGKNFSCDICNLKCSTEQQLKIHKLNVHFIGAAPYFCDVCGLQLRKNGKLYKTHYKLCHQGQLPPANPPPNKVTTFAKNLGTLLQRVPLLEMFPLIDGLYTDGEYYGMHKKPPRIKNIGTISKRKRSRTKKTSSGSESSDFEDSDASSESSSDGDLFSGDSSEEESEPSQYVADYGKLSKNRSLKPRQISLRNIVIKPKRRRKTAVQTSYKSNRRMAETAMPSIILERCDELYKRLQIEWQNSGQLLLKSSSPTPQRETTGSNRTDLARTSSSRLKTGDNQHHIYPRNIKAEVDVRSEGLKDDRIRKSIDISEVEYTRRSTRPSNAMIRFKSDVASEDENSDWHAVDEFEDKDYLTEDSD